MNVKTFLRLIFAIVFALFFYKAATAADVTTFRWGWPANPLLETGQTTKYHDDDDGDLELGVAHSYTVLTTGQYAGNVTVTINGKTYAFSNACVRDNKTGLMWARTVPQSDIGPATDGKLFWEQYTVTGETCTCNATNKTITADAGAPFSTGALCAGRKVAVTGSALGNNATFTVASISTSVITVSEAVTDEASVSLDFATVDDLIWDLVDQANSGSGVAGYTDWRIPNRKELESITNIEEYNPAIDTTVFPSTPASQHWTASTYTNCTPPASWYVNFNDALVNTSYNYKNKYYVRLVRGP